MPRRFGYSSIIKVIMFVSGRPYNIHTYIYDMREVRDPVIWEIPSSFKIL